MEKTIRQINIRKTARSAAVASVSISLIMMVIGLMQGIAHGKNIEIILALFIPVFYFGLIYVFTALYCWFYNLAVTKNWCQGFAFTLDDEGKN
jgi:hypothetical protein